MSLDRFQRDLAPYGAWHRTASYGLVWVPRVDSNQWRPYTDGEWRYTNAGWEFVSSDPFGAVTFHYGRWAWMASLGWAWIPGYQWAPAWVDWRYSNGVVSWAPLAPVGVGLSYYSRPSIWVSVRSGDFGGRLDHRRFLSSARTHDVFVHSRREHWDRRGPPPHEIARTDGRPVVRMPSRVPAHPPAVVPRAPTHERNRRRDEHATARREPDRSQAHGHRGPHGHHR